ncbi:MAG: hypothetical protein Fur002_14560 [Anaerolineales bacterium]
MLLVEPNTGQIIDSNLAAQKFYGYSRQRFQQMNITKIVALPPHEVKKNYEAALRGEANRFTLKHRLASGELRTVETRVSPIDLNGKMLLLSIVQDITSHRQTEERYQALFERMMDGIYRSTHDGKFVDVNPAMAKMFGYASREEMLQADIKRELYFDETERGSHILDTGQEETEIYRMRRKDGSEIWVEDHGSYVHDEAGNIIYHEGILRDVTERVRAQETEKRYAAQMQALYQTSRELSASLEKPQIYAVTRQAIERLLPCNTIFISTYERKTQTIHMAYGWHDGAPVKVEQYPPIPLESEDKGTQSRVIRSGKPLILNDYQESLKHTQTVYHMNERGEPEEEPPQSADIPRSALIAPMIVENQVIGVIQIFSYGKEKYTPNDLNLLNGLASQTAVALINSDLFQQVQQENRERMNAERSLRARTSELETLFSISSQMSFVQMEAEILPHLLAEMERALDADSIALILFDEEKESAAVAHACGEFAANAGQRLKFSSQIFEAWIQSRQIYETDHLAKEADQIALQGADNLGAAIILPILSGDALLGKLIVARKMENSSPFSAEMKRLVITISELLGNALSRMRLHTETLQRLNRLQTLRAIDEAITSSFDLSITLNILLRHVLTQLGADAACILLLQRDEKTLRYAAGQGFRWAEVERTNIHLTQAVCGQSLLERRVIQITNKEEIQAQPHFLKLWAEDQFETYLCAPLIAKGEAQGVLEVYLRRPFAPNEEWIDFFETLAGQAAISIDNAQMFEHLQNANVELAIAYDATIEGWSRALDLRDHETEGHTQRVTELTLQLARAMNLSDQQMLHIRRGALLHDIGKMGIPDNILLKQGELTSAEWEIMRSHPSLAFEMLQPIRYLQPALDIPYAHHERWNGSGYPRGLKGEEIPLAARIFAVVDVYDALTSARPYRGAWSKEKTLAYIQERSGTEFDSHVVNAFLKMINA